MVAAWNEELRHLGYRNPERRSPGSSPSVGSLDRDTAVELVISRLGAKRSSWNAADIRGQVEQWIAEAGLIAAAAVRIELAEDITERAVAACAPLLNRDDVPKHVRGLTSSRVVGVEDRITQLLGLGASIVGRDAHLKPIPAASLDPTQRGAVAGLAGTKCLLVVEGAAGAGKTATLAMAKEVLAKRGQQMMVVSPTLKAAEVAANEIDAPAFSAAWLIHQWGWRWDDDGHWTTTKTMPADPRAVLKRGDLLVVDEAGMLDQDTARALMEIVSVCAARIAFMGDRHQLPAVGRGGVLDLAAQHVGPDATITLDVVHRFADPEYAQISLSMRRRPGVE
ncbi:MAG: AAA family ATPase, partial [Nocardioides sp.]|nr:AAA family ATPase [Nocardioides sp.]